MRTVIKALVTATVGLVVLLPLTLLLIFLGLPVLGALGVLALPLLAVLAIVGLPILLMVVLAVAVIGVLLGLVGAAVGIAVALLKLTLFVVLPVAAVIWFIRWAAGEHRHDARGVAPRYGNGTRGGSRDAGRPFCCTGRRRWCAPLRRDIVYRPDVFPYIAAPAAHHVRRTELPIRERLIDAAKRHLTPSMRNRVVRLQRRFRLQWPPVGTVRFGSFRRLTPISPIFALDRGVPIERYYIERFLDRHRLDVRGRAMEFGDSYYLDRFGDERVDRKDVFSYVPAPDATIVGDLAGDGELPQGAFDCIVCTQTVQMIFDIRLAVRRLHSMLKPGGVLLLTTHGISKVGRHLDRDGWGEYWHLTQQAARSLFDDAFDGEATVEGFGNVLSATCALQGLAATELRPEELDYRDRDFDVIVGVRAVRRA